jgi:hypothetical protein
MGRTLWGIRTSVKTRIAVLGTLLLASCGDTEPRVVPTAHLRQADQICADAQPGLDRSGEGIVGANQAYENSRSRRDLDAIERAWNDAWFTLSGVSKELRAAAAPGLDRDYDRFVTVWKRTTAQADRLVDVVKHDDPQVTEDSFRELQALGRRLRNAARTAGVTRCEAPLSPGGKTSDA